MLSHRWSNAESNHRPISWLSSGGQLLYPIIMPVTILVNIFLAMPENKVFVHAIRSSSEGVKPSSKLTPEKKSNSL